MPSGVADDHFTSAVSTTGPNTQPPPWLTPPVRPPEQLAALPPLDQYAMLNIATRDPIGWFAYGSAITRNTHGTPTQDQGQTEYITS